MTARRARTSFTHAPGTILGYRKDGRPIYPIAGGSEDAPPVPSGDQPPADPPAPQPDPPAKDGDEPLGEPGKKALQAERDARAAAEKREKDLAARLQEIEDRDKTEEQKRAERLAALEESDKSKTAKLLRYEVAAAKDIPLSAADRLKGSTKEEIEADADALKALLAGSGATPPPTPKPDPSQGSGGEPKPRTLADAIGSHYGT